MNRGKEGAAMGVGEGKDLRWRAVLERDRAYDGAFFYAVRTTGIYCRPTCPARRPRRENVEFFETPAAAEAAGYRACHRCHPASATGTPTEHRIGRAMEYLDARRDVRVTLAELGAAVGVSPFHLQRAFRDAVGLSPREYQDARRLESLRARLRDGDDVARAVWGAGYGSYRGAYASAAGMGMTPGEYRGGAAGLAVEYSTHRTGFGIVLVAWTARGVCAVMLGDDPSALAAELAAEFPAAELAPYAPEGSAWIAAILASLEGDHTGPAVPLDVRGSTFQLRVWKALRDIPFGEVRTYGEIAAAIGDPGAARAVGRACATNPTALVVPCHRVVRADGTPGGYRWGAERKARLIEHEHR